MVYVMQCLLSLGMDTTNWVQILDEAAGISYNGNTLGKSIYHTILPPAMSKQ